MFFFIIFDFVLIWVVLHFEFYHNLKIFAFHVFPRKEKIARHFSISFKHPFYVLNVVVHLFGYNIFLSCKTFLLHIFVCCSKKYLSKRFDVTLIFFCYYKTHIHRISWYSFFVKKKISFVRHSLFPPSKHIISTKNYLAQTKFVIKPN